MSSRTATRIHDANTINANTGDMTKSEVIDFFNQKSIEIKSKTGIDTQFVVNTITMQVEGKRQLKGVSFIYFEKSEAYHAMLGNNIDGTERYAYTPDPNWVPSVKVELKEYKTWDDITGNPENDWSEIIGNISNESWADISVPIENKAPMIASRLPPIVDDLRYYRKNGNYVDVSVQPFFITIDEGEDDNLDTHKLFGFVPHGYVIDDIKTKFDIFSHRTGYPIVTVKEGRNGKNIVFITFSHATYDARFAREIMMYTNFDNDIVKFDFPRSIQHSSDSYRSNSGGYKSKFHNSGGYNRNRDRVVEDGSKWGPPRSNSRTTNSTSKSSNMKTMPGFSTGSEKNEYMKKRRNHN